MGLATILVLPKPRSLNLFGLKLGNALQISATTTLIEKIYCYCCTVSGEILFQTRIVRMAREWFSIDLIHYSRHVGFCYYHAN